MCFVKCISSTYSTMPLKATGDIRVKKLLYITVENETITPFRSYPVKFHEGKATLKAIIKSEYIFPYLTVTEGIHSYTLYAKESGDSRFNLQLYKAIIPKGASFYINNSGEVVSDKLIIFDEIIN